MLKGINIGGINRLKYLDFLKKERDDSLEKLETMFLYENNKNNKLIKGGNNDISINNVKHLNFYDNKNQFDELDKKYDEESDYIEKETNFYDFDEQLLHYRPLEIENLAESLIDLKAALLITSQDRQKEEIIDYSYSEKIFNNFKNKEGAIICQSNIGNLQSQLLKFDKAIYHLVLSLQDTKLQKFLDRNLNDELDESDFLLNKMSYTFNKENDEEENNILAVKQINSLKDNFSKKIIGILINTRYCRLIRAYYNFFKHLQKLKKSNSDIINGNFINTTFHTINYYHKILIQFIFLCYFKNDLVKIGESILDYIEFLIKFKFKISFMDKNFFKFENRDNPDCKDKIEFKKKIFEKIIKWFNLFEDYISYVKDNSTLGDLKGLIEDYSKQTLNNDNNAFILGSQSTIMFKLNNQRYDFLKGKFSLICKNYNDALYYFIRAAKVNSIAIDGLIKKRSLKHIYKITLKIQKNYENFKLKHLSIEKELRNKNFIFINKLQLSKRRSKRINTNRIKNPNTFGKEIEKIKKDIIQDINYCNKKKEKDILIMIDFNLYDIQEDFLYSKTYKIDVFIEQTNIILNNYLSMDDRIGISIYSNEYQLICPLTQLNKIDINSISRDLINYKDKFFNIKEETEEYDINFDEFNDYDESKFNLEGNNESENLKESFDMSEIEEEKNYDKIIGIVKGINFMNNYFRMKGEAKNEKYIILFTDIINIKSMEKAQIEKIKDILSGDKITIFLIIGKIKKMNLKNDENNLGKLILSKFGVKSEIIYFENMNKIKVILSNKECYKR